MVGNELASWLKHTHSFLLITITYRAIFRLHISVVPFANWLVRLFLKSNSALRLESTGSLFYSRVTAIVRMDHSPYIIRMTERIWSREVAEWLKLGAWEGVNQRRSALWKPSLFTQLSVLSKTFLSHCYQNYNRSYSTLFASAVKFWYQLYCHLLFPYAFIKMAS